MTPMATRKPAISYVRIHVALNEFREDPWAGIYSRRFNHDPVRMPSIATHCTRDIAIINNF